jgi:hypothetical protein
MIDEPRAACSRIRRQSGPETATSHAAGQSHAAMGGLPRLCRGPARESRPSWLLPRWPPNPCIRQIRRAVSPLSVAQIKAMRLPLGCHSRAFATGRGGHGPLEMPPNASEWRVVLAIKAVTSFPMHFVPHSRKTQESWARGEDEWWLHISESATQAGSPVVSWILSGWSSVGGGLSERPDQCGHEILTDVTAIDPFRRGHIFAVWAA